MLTVAVQTGERNEQVGMVTGRVSGWLGQDLKERFNAAARMIEPSMIVDIGTIVGAIATPMLLRILAFVRSPGRQLAPLPAEPMVSYGVSPYK